MDEKLKSHPFFCYFNIFNIYLQKLKSDDVKYIFNFHRNKNL